jgi:hypothetical protein
MEEWLPIDSNATTKVRSLYTHSEGGGLSQKCSVTRLHSVKRQMYWDWWRAKVRPPRIRAPRRAFFFLTLEGGAQEFEAVQTELREPKTELT